MEILVPSAQHGRMALVYDGRLYAMLGSREGISLEASLHRRLIEVTVGGSGNRAAQIDARHRDEVFAEYVRRALPDVAVSKLETLVTEASLNSVCASCFIDGKKYLLKIHVESEPGADNQRQSTLGVGREYENAELLERSGFPVIAPYLQGQDPDYPLLVYPWVDSDTLFDKLERSYAIGRSLISDLDISRIKEMNSIIGEMTDRSMKRVPAGEAREAPLQALFLKRISPAGRVGEWYKPRTAFELPTHHDRLLCLDWDVLKDAHWIINDNRYESTLSHTIDRARQVLSYEGESTALVSISHGDDHAGNVFVAVGDDYGNVTARLFDPAFTGENPAALAHVKAFAHTGILPMAGMYYDPHLPRVVYEYDPTENLMKVDVDFASTPLFDVHYKLAEQIVDTRITPSFTTMVAGGADIERELERFRCALVGCALLTVNVPLLLKAADHRAVGLLPMAIILYSMSGLPSLEYLRDKVSVK